MSAEVLRFPSKDSVVFEPGKRDGMLPPHDLEAEAAVLAAVMVDSGNDRAVLQVRDLLKPEHFYAESHRRIFEACLALHAKGTPTDVAAVGAELRSKGRIAQVGGMGYLTEILNASPAVVNVRAHAEIVFDRHRLRQLLLVCQRTEAEIYTGAASVSDTQAFLEAASKASITLSNQSPRATGEPFSEVLRRIVAEISATLKSDGKPKRIGLSTSFPTLDAMTGGLLPGKKFTVVGLPGHGKSVVGLQVAARAAESGIGALFFATEQTKDELGIRLMAARAGVDSRKIQRLRSDRFAMTPEEFERFRLGVDANFARLPLVLEHAPGLTIDNIVTRTRTIAETMPLTHGVPLGLVVVDYLQRLAPPKALESAHKVSQVEHSTAELKTLAQDLGVAVLELAQQKSVNDTQGKPIKPALGMVHWSRRPEQEADAVVYIWQPAPNEYRLVVVKARDGETGEIPVDFEKAFSRMSEARAWAP